MRCSSACSAPTLSSSPVPTYPARWKRSTATWPSRPAPASNPPELASLEFPDDVLAADSVAIHFAAGEGLSFYPWYHLLEELFSTPALISRARRPGNR